MLLFEISGSHFVMLFSSEYYNSKLFSLVKLSPILNCQMNDVNLIQRKQLRFSLYHLVSSLGVSLQ